MRYMNLWQSPQWQKYQESLGREVRQYDSSLVVIDRTTGGYSTWETTRVESCKLKMDSDLIKTIVEDAKKDKCFALYFSLERNKTFNLPFTTFNSFRHIVPEATRIIDLTKSEDEILAQMKQKGRYNIKVAMKHDVVVKKSTDVDDFYELIKKTSARDQFKPLSKDRYEAFLNNLGSSFMFIAYTPIEHCLLPIAGLIGVIYKDQGIYYYGASSYEHRNLMAPYLLQWEAMKYCKSNGCTSYDLFGIAPPEKPDHPWKGVSEFKEKFGGSIVSYPVEKIIVLKPLIYNLIQIKRKLFK